MPTFKCLTMMLFVSSIAFWGGCAPAEDAEGADAPGVSGSEAVEMVATGPIESSETENENGGITAESLVGTTWAIADYSVTFEADGVVRFNSGSAGTWSLADDTITIAAAGEETIITVDGDVLMHNGLALEQQ